MVLPADLCVYAFLPWRVLRDHRRLDPRMNGDNQLTARQLGHVVSPPCCGDEQDRFVTLLF